MLPKHLSDFISTLSQEDMDILGKYFCSLNNDVPVRGGHFTSEEDAKLRVLVEKYGESGWKSIAAEMNGRTTRQCRDHWKNYLAPTVQSSPWTDKEVELLIRCHKKYGSKWEHISKFFPGRTGIMIKNKYISLIRKSDKSLLIDDEIQSGVSTDTVASGIEIPLLQQIIPTGNE